MSGVSGAFQWKAPALSAEPVARFGKGGTGEWAAGQRGKSPLFFCPVLPLPSQCPAQTRYFSETPTTTSINPMTDTKSAAMFQTTPR